jgi:hypothetical protein
VFLDNPRNRREDAVFKQTGVDFMKTQTSSGRFPTLTLTVALVLTACTVPAQPATNATANAGPTAPLLSYGVTQIIQLSQANVGDATIVNYIRNSDSSYGLDADQIVYLKQQGVSDTVLNTMLSQPRTTQTAATAQPASATATSTATATVNIVAQPAVTYVPADPIYVPSSSVYVIPDTQTYQYYAYTYHPYYGGRSYLGYRPYYYGTHYSFGAGYGGGHRGGGNYRGGWHH